MSDITTLLKQATELRLLRSLDVQFAQLIATSDEPARLLAAACLSAEAGEGHVCLPLAHLNREKLFRGRHPELAQAIWQAAGEPHDWHSLLAVDARAEAKALGKPMLMLQGGRDFQVPDTDWTLWQQALQGRTDVQWQRFAELNHLGIAGTGASSLQEYGRAGHVDTRLVDAVAGWVKAQR